MLPDAAVRVMLLDFEALPAKHDEAEGVIRFRLKKSLPFDVDKAKVSYHVQPSNGGVRVIAAVALLISFVATLYPSWSAARVLPAEALRYE